MRRLAIAVIFVGSVASAAPRRPDRLEHGKVIVAGTLDAPAVVKIVRASSTKLLACYKQSVVRPSGPATVTVTFTIGAEGTVTTAAADTTTTSAGSCLAATISALLFAKPTDGQPVRVTYPLTFYPGELSDSRPSPSGLASPALVGGLRGTDITEMTGGYSVDRSGGGGGTGTIGSSVVGKGSGHGLVAGGPRSADVPSVAFGLLDVKGDLDKSIVRRYLRRTLPKLTHCYEKQLRDTPTLKGAATIRFTIGADGIVSASTATGLGNTTVETCVATVIKGIEFPKPKGNATVNVTSPLTFMLPAPPATK